MKIAVLAWGSLVWDCRDLSVTGTFAPNGPCLPIEFCRISGNGRMTLVIDDTLGIPCGTYCAASAFDNLKAAAENLRVREGMPSPNGIGFVDLVSGSQGARAVERHPNAVETIKAWTSANDYDAAIWTALASNFQEADKAKAPFSVEAAIWYLETLDPSGLATALTYIRQAPPEVQTPVREAVNERWPEG
jgi:hypothetical protein